MKDLKELSLFNNYKPPVEKPIQVYINGIPGLRTLGIFGVILYHMYPYTIKGGFLGVTLFFIVSGYLLAVKSEESRRNKDFAIGEFYYKRVLRLYPQLLIVLLFVCGILKLILPHVLNGIRGEILSIVLGYNNIWQILQNASYFEKITNSSPFTHLWSLSNELQFYLIWPIIFYLFIYFTRVLDTKKAVSIIGILAFLSGLIMPIMYNPELDVTRIYYGVDTRMFSFLTGAYIGFRRVRYRRNVRIKNEVPYCVLFVVLTVVVIVSYIFMDGEGVFTYRGGMFLINIIMGLMVALVTDTRLPIGIFLEKNIFKYFGNVSYEMYLWMYPVIFISHSMHWNRIPCSGLIMIVVIVALAKWLNSFTKLLVERKLDMDDSFKRRLKQVAFVVISLGFTFVIAQGGYSIVTAPVKDRGDIDEMRQEMEENKKKLEENNAAVKIDSSSTTTPENKQETAAKPTPTPTPTPEEPERPYPVSERKITAIGDSVMLGASPAILEAIPGSIVDAAESRQVSAGVGILENLSANNQIGNTVIVALGTNGIFKTGKGQELIDYLGEDRDIYWVNVFGVDWASDCNDVINELVETNENVYLINWNEEGAKHPDWFYNDGIHLKAEGQTGYAEFLKSVVLN